MTAGTSGFAASIFILLTPLQSVSGFKKDPLITDKSRHRWQILAPNWEEYGLVSGQFRHSEITEDWTPMERKTTAAAAAPLIDPKLATALANPWRNRVLMEVHLRPMSPKQFDEQFGGPGLTVTARYFRELKDWGYLEVAEELRGGKRRGATEKIYRAIQRVYFDTEGWERLPQYLRAECSVAILHSLLGRIGTAVEAETLDAEPDRHLSWREVQFDRQAWLEYTARLDEILAWSIQLEEGSAERLATGENDEIPVTLALMAFRSAPVGYDNESAGEARILSRNSPPAHFLISAQTAKALANPWRNRILIELHEQPMSPRQFDKKFPGAGARRIAHYFRQLRTWGYLEVVEELRGGTRRGAIEKVHRAIRRAYFDTATWEKLPSELRSECSGSVLDGLVVRIGRAVSANTFDLDGDRHLSWKSVLLDRRAWGKYVSRLDDLLAWSVVLETESAIRLAASNEEPMQATVAQLAFRSPAS